ncbi:MAG: hypothetical protein H6765_06915 [Candidatus Peribacteria bacterium]|nr:MAG: hypothetical protein H6765_06915 [Candidatus Peribacteria bacterium]
MAKQNHSLKALEELLNKIETEAKRARLMVQQLVDQQGETIEDVQIDLQAISDKLVSYEDNDNIMVVE